MGRQAGRLRGPGAAGTPCSVQGAPEPALRFSLCTEKTCFLLLGQGLTPTFCAQEMGAWKSSRSQLWAPPLLQI